MRFFQIIWDEDGNPDGNVQHVAEHGLTIGDVEHVLEDPEQEGLSNSSGRPYFRGYTPGGDYIMVIYEQVDEDTIYVVTAFEVTEF